VMTRIHDALLPGGVLLISMREGVGVEHHGPWYTALWEESELAPVLVDAGFRVEYRSLQGDSSGERWLTYLLVKGA